MSERLRLANNLLVKIIEASLNAEPVANEVPTANEPRSRRVLPPYLGEMGLEIRFFLAAVEPWLRNGWTLPARRPALYPPGAAFADPGLFTEIDRLIHDHDARAVVSTLSFVDGAGGQATRLIVAASGPALRVDVSNDQPEEIRRLIRTARLERSLKQVFAKHHLRQPRPLTLWDGLLTATLDGDPAQMTVGASALAPSWQPDAFVRPRPNRSPHVGVQIRALGDQRDSDVTRMMAAATQAATHLHLPLLVYGHPRGTIRPAGYAATAERAPGDLLDYELSQLAACRLMLSPDSGWCDLMCWLRVPTLLEQQSMAFNYAAMEVFQPRVALLQAAPVAGQIDCLLARPTSLPDPRASPVQESFLDWDGGWMRARVRDFLHEGCPG